MDISDIRILSAGTALPGHPIDNAALARRFRMDSVWEQWVDAFVGTRSRHLSVDLQTGEVRQTLADLAVTAGHRALAGAGIDGADIDLVVMGTATPDTLMPATVNVVADRLGIDGVPTYQLQSGCAGAVQALDVARHMLWAGGSRTALVLAGDVSTKYFDLDLDLRKLPPAELVNVVLFGDGAGAAVLTSDPVPGSTALREVLNRLTGKDRAPGHVLDWFGPADRHSERPGAREDFKAIEQHVPTMAAEVLAELLDRLAWRPTDVDYLLPPQLSGRMTARIVEQLALPVATEISCVEETGNNGNALPFLQLERVLAKMAPGDRALGIAIESSKWIKSGFALERR
jgi:3-oxoacyl-[acyl-carrier-protein] synthase-3